MCSDNYSTIDKKNIKNTLKTHDSILVCLYTLDVPPVLLTHNTNWRARHRRFVFIDGPYPPIHPHQPNRVFLSRFLWSSSPSEWFSSRCIVKTT